MRVPLVPSLIIGYLLVLAVFCIIYAKTLFTWPSGIVTGNLIASAIWAPLALVHIDRRAGMRHREHLELVRRHHEEMKAHVEKVHRDG
jgi:hypothetical protein